MSIGSTVGLFHKPTGIAAAILSLSAHERSKLIKQELDSRTEGDSEQGNREKDELTKENQRLRQELEELRRRPGSPTR